MKNSFKKPIFSIGLIFMMLAGTIAWPQNRLTDPYEIYNHYFQAIGGLDKVKAVITLHLKADISAYGLQGTVEIWNQAPIYERQKVDLKVFRETSGDNGQFRWSADANGKVQIHKDEDLLKRREIQKLAASFDFLDRHSAVFKLTFNGIEKEGNNDCYVVTMTNSINGDSTKTYFQTDNFLVAKEIAYTPRGESHTLSSDYRDVNGVLRAFHQETTELPEGNVTITQFTLYEPNIEIDPALFEPPRQDARDFHFTGGENSPDVPFEYIIDHIFIPVNIGGKERLWIFDTGAEVTCVDSAFADTLGLATDGSIVGKGSGGTVNFNFVKIPSLSIKGIQFEEQAAVAINLNKILAPFSMEAAGILGYDFISRFIIKVDYAKKTMSFYDPDKFVYQGDGQILEAPLKGKIPVIPATVDGKYSGKWTIDLGAGTTDFQYPFAEANGLLKIKGIENVSFGASGAQKEQILSFASFELAGFKIGRSLIGMPLQKGTGSSSDPEIIGNMGNDIFRHFTLYIDFTHQKLIFEKGADFDRQFPQAKSGLQLIYNSQHQLSVLFVAPGTPAQKAGFMINDVVLAINDIDVGFFNGMIAFRDLLKAPAGTKYKFTVLHENQKKDLYLTLADLYK